MPSTKERARVLVVDDDPMVLDALEVVLGDHWEVFTAGSAAEGRTVLESEKIAVVVSDQRMPGESGVDLLSWALEHSPDTIRILLTGYTDLDTVVQAINQGQVWYYIRKPWDNHHVVALLTRAIDYRERTLEARTRFQGAIRLLVLALEASHPYTSGHSTRVTRYSEVIAHAMGLRSRDRDNVILAAQLHDIGKIGVDNRYLDKEGALTEEEWGSVQTHVTMGARLLEEGGFLEPIIPLLASQHESLDGSGYPDGKVGDEIPLGGRIIALADAFDAMTSDRAYRKAMPVEDAVSELRACAGQQFDPAVVEAFCRALPADVQSLHSPSVEGLARSFVPPRPSWDDTDDITLEADLMAEEALVEDEG